MEAPHAHICPRCARAFEHRRFVYQRDWNALERIVARSLHRFYGACAPCIRKFMKTGFFEDKEIPFLRTQETPSGVLYSGKAGPVDVPVELVAPGPL